MKKNDTTKRFATTRKLLCFLCISICSSLTMSAQNAEEINPVSATITRSIHPSLNNFTFKLDCYTDDMGMCHTQTITVIDAKTGQKIQTITTADFNSGDDVCTLSYETLDLIVEDLNFDGYADIRINAFVTAGANRLEVCWLWTPKRKRFIYNHRLSELVNLDVDGENKMLESFTRVNAATYHTEYYKYIDGILTLIRSIDDVYHMAE